MGQIVLYLEIFNFKTFRAEILQIFELLIWKIYDFINSFWLYLTSSTYFILLTQMQWSVTKSSQLLAASQFCSPNYQSICKHFPRKWILDFHFFLLQKGYRQALKEDSYCAGDSFWYLLTYINENLHDHHCSPTELAWVEELWWF